MTRSQSVTSILWGAIASVIGIAIVVIVTPANSYKSALLNRLGLGVDPNLCQSFDAMKRYLNAGGSPNAVIITGGSAEIKQSLLECVEPEAAVLLLLERKDLDLNTELYNAVTSGNTPIAEKLLAKGADVNRRFQEGQTLLHLTRSPGIAALLIDQGVSINTRDQNGRTPLHTASTYDVTQDMAAFLINKGADVNAINRDAISPLHLATAAIQNVETVKLLIEHGANVHAKDKNGNTPLHRVAREDVVELLLSRGADPNGKGEDARTPLSIAVGSESSSLHRINLLLTPETKINARDGYGMTLLHWAAKSGNVAVLKLLLAKGADVNVKRNDGMTALAIAAQQPNADKMELLLAKDADPNTKDKSGRTALHVVASTAAIDKKKAFELLLGQNSDINAKDNEGNTPLRLAEKAQLKGEVKFLKQHGALE